MMRLALSLPVLLAAAGCGNFSNEDLVFLAGVPTARELAMDVEAAPGAEPGALVGEPAQLYALAQHASEEVNAGVEGLLELVDDLGQGHPPTERTDERRIWGPIEDVDHTGVTLRLEIRREDRAGGKPRFVFCVHAAPDGELDEDDIECDTSTDGPLPAVLSGSYDPEDAEASARSGSGRIVLNFDAARRAGTAKGFERGVLQLDYDFSLGGRAKDIALSLERKALFGDEQLVTTYDYSRVADGYTEFAVSSPENKVGAYALETVLFQAAWDPDGLGRGEMSVTGGDVPADRTIGGTECWDAAQLRTYLVWEVEGRPDLSGQEGDLAACPP